MDQIKEAVQKVTHRAEEAGTEVSAISHRPDLSKIVTSSRPWAGWLASQSELYVCLWLGGVVDASLHQLLTRRSHVSPLALLVHNGLPLNSKACIWLSRLLDNPPACHWTSSGLGSAAVRAAACTCYT